MKVTIDIPSNPTDEVIERNGLTLVGGFCVEEEKGSKLVAVIKDNALTIVGNKAGLLTLANLCYNLAQDGVGDFYHQHVDQDNELLIEGSEFLIFEKANDVEAFK